MKTNIKIISVFLILMTSCIIYPRQTSAQESNVSFQVFYDQLSPYGQWIDDMNYGYVWIPDSGPDFVPYSTDGHWILTDYGWTWASDYEWGWATFHYGRWSFNDSFGWFWVPDNEWGPAWVNWRQSDGYYGWSPMEPGITLSMSFGRAYENNNNHWMFVRDRDIERQDINHYYISRSDQDRIGRNSIVINNTYKDNVRHTTYVSGPTRIQVQKIVGRTITPVVIRENNKPGQEIKDGQLRIYRPQVVNNNNDGRKPAPSKVSNKNDVKRSPAINSTNRNQESNPVNRTITQPIRTVTPQNNNSQPGQQRNTNQQDIQQVPQNRPSAPVNTNRNIQPVQTPSSTPSDINRPIRKPDVVKPFNNTPQPVQQRTVTPQNNPQPIQQRTIAPQKNNSQPIQQRNVTPQNNPQPVQQRNETPQSNPQPVQQRKATPQNNNVQQDQQRNVAPQNNNPGQRTSAPASVDNRSQSAKNQNVKPSNRPVKQQKSIKQEIRKEQEKIPDAVNDKK